jgi:hypothetical protein
MIIRCHGVQLPLIVRASPEESNAIRIISLALFSSPLNPEQVRKTIAKAKRRADIGAHGLEEYSVY